MKYKVGQEVTHKSRGKGIIVKVDEDDHTYFVDFGKGGIWCGEHRIITPATLSTAEMISALAVNPEQRYRDEIGRTCSNYVGQIRVISRSGADSILDIKEKWTLIPPEPKPVPFLEAVKALHIGIRIVYKLTRCDGKAIEHIFDRPTKFVSDKGWTIDAEAIVGESGQWFIRED